MFIIDIKTMNETIYQEYTKKNNQNVLFYTYLIHCVENKIKTEYIFQPN